MLAAARDGDTSIVETVLLHGAHVNTRGEQGRTPLIWSSSRGHSEIVTLLLDKGADLHLKNKDGVTALMCAALDGHLAVVEVLLARGARVDETDRNGITALMAASYRGHVATVKFLIAKGAQVNAQDRKGETALIRAVKGEYIDRLEALPGSPTLIRAAGEDLDRTVRVLLAAGANPNLPSKDGQTALAHATARGKTDLLRLLQNPAVGRE